MTLPIPTLDHVVINVRDALADAAAVYARLGFTLTPRGRHTLGTENHLAIFGTDYLELLGAPDGRADLVPMAWPAGLNAIVFGTENAAATRAALAGAGIAAGEVLSFSRPVADGEASFRTVALEAFPAGRAYFCQHLTRRLVWQDETRRHANGVVGVDGIVIAAADPNGVIAALTAIFGPEFRTPDGLACGLTRIEVLSPERLAERYGVETPAPAATPHLAVLRLRSADIRRTASVLQGVAEDSRATGLVVPARAAFGVALAFVG